MNVSCNIVTCDHCDDRNWRALLFLRCIGKKKNCLSAAVSFARRNRVVVDRFTHMCTQIGVCFSMSITLMHVHWPIITGSLLINRLVNIVIASSVGSRLMKLYLIQWDMLRVIPRFSYNSIAYLTIAELLCTMHQLLSPWRRLARYLKMCVWVCAHTHTHTYISCGLPPLCLGLFYNSSVWWQNGSLCCCIGTALRSAELMTPCRAHNVLSVCEVCWCIHTTPIEFKQIDRRRWQAATGACLQW